MWINQGFAQAGTEGVFVDSGQTLGTLISESLALGDVDSLVDLDAIVGTSGAGFGSGETLFFKGDGFGGFVDNGPTGMSGAATYDIALGDFDGDLDLDIYEANGSGTPDRIFFNNGSGVFTFNQIFFGGGYSCR